MTGRKMGSGSSASHPISGRTLFIKDDQLKVAIKLLTLPIAAFALIFADRTILAMDSSFATALASLFILFAGIPHGTLDVEIALERFQRQGLSTRTAIISAYVFAGAAMLGIWSYYPSLALVCFLCLSIVHFAADWHGDGEKFFAFSVGWALIAVPALSHTQDVAVIFEMLTADGNGRTIAALLACSSIPAAFGTLIFALKAFERSDHAVAVNVISCLAAAVFLPPLVGFAVFFCGLHSPRHLREAIRQAGAASRIEKLVRSSAVMALTVGLGVLLFVSQSTASIDAGVVRMAFVLLSILTVPHFILELWIERNEEKPILSQR